MNAQGTVPVNSALPQAHLASGLVQPGLQPGAIHTTGLYQQRAPPCCGRVVEKLLAKPVLTLGVTQVTIGVLSIIFSIVGIVYQSQVAAVSHGIWCGIFFILAGSFGIAAGSKKTVCFIVTCMTLSIVAGIFCIPVITAASIGLTSEKENYEFYQYVAPDPSCCNYNSFGTRTTDMSCCYEDLSYYDTSNLHLREAMHGILLVLGIIEGIVAIVTACICCHAVCCCATQQGNVLRHPGVQYALPGQGIQVVLIQGQNGAFQAIPVNSQVYGNNAQAGMASQPQMAQCDQPSQPQPVQPMAPPVYTTEPASGSPPPEYQLQVPQAAGNPEQKSP